VDDIAEALRNTTEDGADPDLIYRAAEEIERLREDAVRLDWLEQHAGATERECFDSVDAWRTPDGRRHGGGLRYAIDAAMTPNVEHNRRPQGVRVDGPVGPHREGETS